MLLRTNVKIDQYHWVCVMSNIQYMPQGFLFAMIKNQMFSQVTIVSKRNEEKEKQKEINKKQEKNEK